MKFGDMSTIDADQVVFEVTPTFTESRTVNYTSVDPIHMPGSIQMYRSTGSRTFEVGAQLISRNAEDAQRNIRYLQTLRGWTMPYFGETTTLSEPNVRSREQNATLSRETANANSINRVHSDEGVELRGAPPDVLYLFAYSMGPSSVGTRSNPTPNINRVPVVVTNLSIAYPDDIDYIPVNVGDVYEPFPIKLTVNISLVETHSPNEYERFDLAAFKAGTLANF